MCFLLLGFGRTRQLCLKDADILNYACLQCVQPAELSVPVDGVRGKGCSGLPAVRWVGAQGVAQLVTVRDLLSLWGGDVEQVQDGVCAGKVHSLVHSLLQKLGSLSGQWKVSSGKKAHHK